MEINDKTLASNMAPTHRYLTYVEKLKAHHFSNLSMSAEAKKSMADLARDLLTEIATELHKILKTSKSTRVTLDQAKGALELTLPIDIDRRTKFIEKLVREHVQPFKSNHAGSSKKPITLEKRAKLCFPITKTKRELQECEGVKVFTEAAVLITAALENVVLEFLESSSKSAIDGKKSRISADILTQAQGNNEELKSEFAGAHFRGGGYVPKVEKKETARKSSHATRKSTRRTESHDTAESYFSSWF